jgi:hypothetical protein
VDIFISSFLALKQQKKGPPSMVKQLAIRR